MGVLEEVGGEGRVSLRIATVVGRSRRADLRLDNDMVSGLHALIQWNDGRWEVKDLGSHNGTVLGGRRVPTGDVSCLGAGDEIWFGDESVAWRICDVTPPAALATDDDGTEVEGEYGMLLLPTTGPSVTVFRSTLGGWRVETDDGIVPTQDGAIVVVEGRRWTLVLPEVTSPTKTNAVGAPLSVSTLRFEFAPGERTRLHVRHEQRVFDIGEGLHVDLLLLLGRARAGALGAENVVGGDGWIGREFVVERLGVSPNHLNVAIHRARRRFGEIGVEDAFEVVQRRRGELRMGCPNVVVSG